MENSTHYFATYNHTTAHQARASDRALRAASQRLQTPLVSSDPVSPEPPRIVRRKPNRFRHHVKFHSIFETGDLPRPPVHVHPPQSAVQGPHQSPACASTQQLIPQLFYPVPPPPPPPPEQHRRDTNTAARMLLTLADHAPPIFP
ncbi:unnamed protein product [Phytophthora fragariaefolia]|uniref:Unnamed protein product n=1 Tax=Phytophthora fragariaefolia TaxID=1490495 RepID=A0A9W6X384_9STRA|nr:unnamed protein product [Phytophthora fragariaefolia]